MKGREESVESSRTDLRGKNTLFMSVLRSQITNNGSLIMVSPPPSEAD